MERVPISVTSEWGQLKSAISHNASNMINCPDQADLFTAEELAKHPEQGPIVRNQFQSQHSRFRQLLAQSGVQLVAPETQPGAFCQVYTRDFGFVVDRTFFISTAIRDDYRKPEVEGLKSIVQNVDGEVCELNQGITEGGDIMVINDNLVFVGIGNTTDQEGYQNLANHLREKGIAKIESVPHFALHLDCCLAPLPNGKVLHSQSRLPKSSREMLKPYFSEFIPLDPKEDVIDLAANIVWLNPEEVVSTQNARKTNQLLREMGYKVHVVKYGQPIRFWG